MRRKSVFTLWCLLLVFNSRIYSQTISEDILQQPWHAQWLTAPGTGPMNQWIAAGESSLKEYGVYKFRKTVELASIPASFIVHVSGDNRYKLYVNGQLVSIGPARGDLYFWNFETINIAKYLKQGKNTIAALVWNDGKQKPEAQISYLTGFILQGNTAAEEILNTNDSWKCIKDSSYSPLTPVVPGYYVAGPGELVQMNKNAKGWLKPDYDDSSWPKARTIGNGLTKDAAHDSRGWMLVPSPLPQMELTVQRLSFVRNSTVPTPSDFPLKTAAVTIPSNTTATLLLDQTFLTNAYPTLVFSKGKDAGISMSYAEGLYLSANAYGGKSNRNEVEGKVFVGKKDSIISDGSDKQQFTSMWWRTYRYVQLIVTTRDEPLIIEDIYGAFTGYPFTRVANFESQDTALSRMLDIGWRTARLCAFETYMDCPYYEQLQYIGDARIQALVTLYNTNDDRLVRNALTLMDHSRIAEGITLSRYPTDLQQQIPTFSLWWIGMLHDYWMYRPDTSFIKDKLPGERQVLEFFHRYQQPDGSLKNVPYWIFTDWVDDQKGWNGGDAPVSKAGYSAVLDIQLMWTYKIAAEMEAAMGLMDFAKLYNNRAAQLKQTIQKKYWDSTKQLYSDTEDKELYSQHANSLAILAGMVNGNQAHAIGAKLLSDPALALASIYFKYYLHQALVKAGYGNDYLDWLDKWKENIKMGLTTWAEMSDVSRSRSDCHAWGSSPNIEFYRTVLGIDAAMPGFKKIQVAPHVGSLKKVSGSMPHPDGMVSASYEYNTGKWHAVIDLPLHTPGTLKWKDKKYELKPGKNNLILP